MWVEWYLLKKITSFLYVALPFQCNYELRVSFDFYMYKAHESPVISHFCSLIMNVLPLKCSLYYKSLTMTCQLWLYHSE